MEMIYADFEKMVLERPGTQIQLSLIGGVASTRMSLFEFRRDWLRQGFKGLRVAFDVVDPENKIVEIRALFDPQDEKFDWPEWFDRQ